MKCSKCNKKLEKIGKFYRCPNCETYCDKCGVLVHENAKKCPNCHTKFDEEEKDVATKKEFDPLSKDHYIGISSFLTSILGLFLINYSISLFLGFLGAVLGIFGLIKLKNYPLKQKSITILGLIFGVVLVLTFMFGSAKSNTDSSTELYCGDNWCNNGETCTSCSVDCGTCKFCGDGTCNNEESCDTCSTDCGSCGYCGDNICNNGETDATCHFDCLTKEPVCGDNKCDSTESCTTCSVDCGVCKQDIKPVTTNKPSSNSFTSLTNAEPYYSGFCDKIDPYDIDVRKAAAEAIRNDPGSYSDAQLFDIYDWVKKNIIYQNVALGGIPYSPDQTLATKSGDCKNQAVLIVSMIKAIGGTAKVVADPSCSHAYAMVYFGKSDSHISSFTDAVSAHYGTDVVVNYITSNGEIWVIFDPAGGYYPGNTLDECSGARDVYYIDSCLECKALYPNMPFTFNEKCYESCPSGTISNNGLTCIPCPEGFYSYNNKCVSCDSGFILGKDGKCHQPCGDSNTYCTSGYCFNGRCVDCQAGYYLTTDGKCYRS